MMMMVHSFPLVKTITVSMSHSLAMMLIVVNLLTSIISSQTVTYDANTARQYEDQNITCNNGMDCQIICDQNYACRDATIICPTNNQCNVICSAQQSCSSITIIPPQDQSLFDLIFNGPQALSQVEYPIHPVDDFSNFSLICDIPSQCDSMTVTCPAHAYCDIHCIADYACDFVCVH